MVRVIILTIITIYAIIGVRKEIKEDNKFLKPKKYGKRV